MTNKGKLICVGSGIRAISQFTLEAQSCIREADMVYISVADPVTVKWIQEQNKNHFDLYQYYANDKPRIITYAQMTERMLMDVRAGKYVVSVFYGHPGVFVNPSHNAIAIAKSEGYYAKMLPGISAEDCLFADLGIDPSRIGLQTVEATDLLLQKRELQIDTNVIIWQVGCVGDVGFQFSGFENTCFPVFLDYLASFYGEDHKLTNYIAPQYPTGEPVIEEYSIAELREPENARRVSGISTFFIPPRVNKGGDKAMAAQLGLSIQDKPLSPFPQIDLAEYKENQKTTQQLLATHVLPEGYPLASPSEAVYTFMKGLAESYTEWLKFAEDRGSYISNYPGLSDTERRTLHTGHSGAIRLMMQTSAEKEAKRFVHDSIIDSNISHDYQELIQVASNALEEGKCSEQQFIDNTRGWLVDKGYLTTVAHVTTTVQEIKSSSDWTGTYQMYIKQSDNKYTLGPVVILNSQTSLTIDGVSIKDFNLVGNDLLWSASNGNPSTASLTFYTSSKGSKGFYGKYWTTGEDEPSDDNASGETISSAPLSSWNDKYYAADLVNGKWQNSGTLTVSDPTVTYNKTIKGYTYGGNELAWTMEAGNAQNVVISFLNDSKGNPEFYGYKWTSGSKPTTANFSGTKDSGGQPSVTVAAIVTKATAQATATSTSASASATATATATATSATATSATVTVVAFEAAQKIHELSMKAGLDVDRVKQATEALVQGRKLRTSSI